MMPLHVGQAWPHQMKMVKYRKPMGWQPMLVFRLAAERPVSVQLCEAAKIFAAQSKQTATMAFLHQMPSGAEEFETADTLNVTWADWVPDGFAAVYRGGTEQPEEGKNGQ